MKVYSISVNSSDFRSLQFRQSYDAMSRLPILNEAKPVDWNPPIASILNAEKPIADFIAVGSDVIVYQEDTMDDYPDGKPCGDDDSLVALIEMACYGVQASVRSETKEQYPVLMVTECCNALDKDNTVWERSENGESASIKKFAFHKERIDSSSGLFRLADPVLDSQYVFAYTCVDEYEIWDHRFYDRYMSACKTGLIFTEVWSSQK